MRYILSCLVASLVSAGNYFEGSCPDLDNLPRPDSDISHLVENPLYIILTPQNRNEDLKCEVYVGKNVDQETG